VRMKERRLGLRLTDASVAGSGAVEDEVGAVAGGAIEEGETRSGSDDFIGVGDGDADG
jgi:hypothetical protein